MQINGNMIEYSDDNIKHSSLKKYEKAGCNKWKVGIANRSFLKHYKEKVNQVGKITMMEVEWCGGEGGGDPTL